MADDGGDVTLYWFRNNSSQKRSLKYWRTQLTTCLVSNKSMLTKKAMPYIQKKKLMLRLTAWLTMWLEDCVN